MKQLGQVRPPSTTAVSIFSPETNISVSLDNIVICNTTGTDDTYSIFADNDGATFDESTALAFGISIVANTTVVFELQMAIGLASGNLGVQSGTANALTFTVHG